MKASPLQEPATPAPPLQPLGRLAGAFYLLTFLTGAAALPAGRLILSDNPAVTAANIVAHQTLFRLGFAAYVCNIAVYIVVTLLFYRLYKPVSGMASLLAAFFSLIGCAIQATSTIFYLAPLTILGGAPYLAIFNLQELHALAFLFLKLYTQSYNAGLVFFGCYCFLIGMLILRSTFMPRILGICMACAGIAWLTFLWPPLAAHLAPWNMAIGALGEASLTLYLLIVGVDANRWRQQQRTSRL